MCWSILTSRCACSAWCRTHKKNTVSVFHSPLNSGRQETILQYTVSLSTACHCKQCFYDDSVTTNRKTYFCLHVKCFIFLSGFIQLFSTDLHEVPNIKSHRTPPSRSHADTCRQKDGWTDMTKLVGAFYSHANNLQCDQTVLSQYL